ncbi:unnamed protein product [Candidula unifasciata]|uniref:Polysaccharide pyruvyl transferase domain-containing protein n=1 Tax=Candidula unifasciata TaxID=100452 RepID=A0A8S3ZMK0_9EUPU|nr:unnamed protein product [Candidula unifasciata]
MLIDIATYDNKGDTAITVRPGHSTTVRHTPAPTSQAYLKLHALMRNIPKNELVILMQGGGNLVGYAYVDMIRQKYIERFPERKIIILSQSIFLNPKGQEYLQYSRNLYSNRSNLVILLRDRHSYKRAKTMFHGVQIILAPDLAFGIGMVPRQLPPIYDIIWIKRYDLEAPKKYTIPQFPPGVSVEVSDWLYWRTNKPPNDLDKSFQITSVGFQFLQRGRIVVTERLHGHVLSTLMNIPHVLIDNPPYFKLSSFYASWTVNLQNIKLVSNGSLALGAAIELLQKYDRFLPSIGPKDMNAPSNG